MYASGLMQRLGATCYKSLAVNGVTIVPHEFISCHSIQLTLTGRGGKLIFPNMLPCVLGARLEVRMENKAAGPVGVSAGPAQLEIPPGWRVNFIFYCSASLHGWSHTGLERSQVKVQDSGNYSWNHPESNNRFFRFRQVGKH
jgi:hypothetical protein